MPPAANTNAAIEFLDKWAPEGPWTLTAISVDHGGLDGGNFRPASRTEAASWIDQHQGKSNIYFSVNPVRRDVVKKASRQDIKSLAWLHVDVDPRVGDPGASEEEKAEHNASERVRILDLFTDNLPMGVPHPSVVVFSGGGYQAFWKLDAPVALDGGEDQYEDAKRWNLQLEKVFCADNCHNVDRIMRLPGTINLPDKKKRKKGRIAKLAELVTFTDKVYSLDDFTAAPKVQLDNTGFDGRKIEITGNIKRIDEVDELDELAIGAGCTPISNLVKVLIVQGIDPDEPNRYASRSEPLFAVVCELVNKQISDEIIYSVITDPDLCISESVLEKKGGSHKYALKQIAAAHESTVHPMLPDMNRKFAVIGNYGGRCKIMQDTWDESLKRSKLKMQSFGDFMNRYGHKKVQLGTDGKGNPKFVGLGKWWLENEHRRQYEEIVFAPGAEPMEDVYNLWRGFKYDAIPGDCSLYIKHLQDNICSGNAEHYDYLIKWMARCVQTPRTRGETAVVLRGKQGTGKGVFVSAFGDLFGRHFLQVSNPKHLVGNFNVHLRDCSILFGDEAFFAGDKAHSGVLKTMVTESMIMVEPKGVDADLQPSYLHVILASNNSWVVPAGEDERRFFVLDVDSTEMQNVEYFKAILDELNSGGREALLHMLLTLDLTGFQVRDVPKTEALIDQKIRSFSPEQEWWYGKLIAGRLIDEHEDWKSFVSTKGLIDDYINYTQRLGARRGNATQLGLFLKSAVSVLNRKHRILTVNVEDKEGELHAVTRRTPVYVLPELSDCRDHFDEHHGGPWPWPADTGELDEGCEPPPITSPF